MESRGGFTLCLYIMLCTQCCVLKLQTNGFNIVECDVEYIECTCKSYMLSFTWVDGFFEECVMFGIWKSIEGFKANTRIVLFIKQ